MTRTRRIRTIVQTTLLALLTSAVLVDSAWAAEPAVVVRTDESGFDSKAALRFPAGVPYHEITLPTVPADQAAPKGVVMIVHGGSWTQVGANKVVDVRGMARRWQDRGWLTVSIDYTAGLQSVADVDMFLGSIRAWQGNGVPIGIEGASAGGHLALMTAVRRPGTSFVIGMAPVTDPSRVVEAGGSVNVQNYAQRYFGDEAGTTYSPVFRAGEIRSSMDILVATSDADTVVPGPQLDYLRDARPQTQVMHLPGGVAGDSTIFAHADTTHAAFQQFLAAEQALGDKHALS